MSEEETKKEKGKIEFKYIFPEDYNPAYANGAYGGLSSKGEIVINFYTERVPLPYSVVNELDEENGVIGDELKRDPKNEHPLMVRFITGGVILSPSSAKTIHEWLGKHLAVLEAAEEKKSDDIQEH